MQEELLKRLDLLSLKLGVATEHLYAALIKQVYVNAVYAIIWLILGLVLVFKIKPVFKMLRKHGEESDYYSLAKDQFWSGSWLAISVLTVILIMVFSISSLIQVLNPEYQAIKEILKVLQ